MSYCQKFPGSTNSLKLVGLAGGRKYNVCVEVYPNHSKNQVIESNTLVSRTISPCLVRPPRVQLLSKTPKITHLWELEVKPLKSEQLGE